MSFQELQLPDYLLKAIEKREYTQASPIQQQAIPAILTGQDLIAEAKTGTGKTASFALPIIKQLNDLPEKKKKVSVLSLTLAPTRELALQVAASFKAYAKFSPKELKTVCVIGGEDVEEQMKSLRMGADIVVATPGRLLDLIERDAIRLVELESLVLDEADKMLDLGFSAELDTLLEKLPKERQTLFFSATVPDKVIELSKTLLNDPVRIRIEEELATVEAIEQRVIEVNFDNRRPLLQKLIKDEEWSQVIVFVASKRAAVNLSAKMNRDGFSAAGFHGDLEQEERIAVLKKFKSKEVSILICTDIAARGIDISKLPYVVNYDLPRSPLDYVHRIGRTGRAGEAGHAVSFIDQESAQHFRVIEKKAGIRLERIQVSGFELTGDAIKRQKGKPPVKGKRKSKKDKLREQQARDARREEE